MKQTKKTNTTGIEGKRLCLNGFTWDGEWKSNKAKPVIRTRCFHWSSLGSTPGQGIKIPQASWLNQKKKSKISPCGLHVISRLSILSCLREQSRKRMAQITCPTWTQSLRNANRTLPLLAFKLWNDQIKNPWSLIFRPGRKQKDSN